MAPSVKIQSTLFLFVFYIVNYQIKQVITESVLLNLTALSEFNQTKYNVQISLNLGVGENKTLVNGFPVKSSEVTRITCPAVLVEDSSLSDAPLSSELRLMLNQSDVQSEAGELLLSLILSHEIIQLADEKVQQADAGELEILWNQSSERIVQLTNLDPSSGNKLALIPRENDMFVTDAFSVEEQILNTTGNYLFKNPETTQEEVAAPGKLPETPLRMEPQNRIVTCIDLTMDLEENEKILQSTRTSNNVICQWVEELKQKLSLFWPESVPLFFQIMWVVVVGVAGSAIIIKILDLLFPFCDDRDYFHLNPETLMPDDEKQILIENMEEEREEKRPLE